MAIQIWSGHLWDPGWAQHFGLAEVGCGEMLSLTHPETILEAQNNLLQAGADVISTNTLGANQNVMDQHGIGSFVSEVNFESARLARTASAEFSTSKSRRLVAGSVGPTWLGASELEERSPRFSELYAGYVEQISALAKGGVDLLHVEGCQNLVIAKAALIAAQDVQVELGRQIPVIVSATIEGNSTMLDDHSYHDLRAMACQFTSVACGVFSNAFLPGIEWVETPETMAAALARAAVYLNLHVIGISCGTRADYIAALVKLVRG